MTAARTPTSLSVIGAVLVSFAASSLLAAAWDGIAVSRFVILPSSTSLSNPLSVTFHLTAALSAILLTLIVPGLAALEVACWMSARIRTRARAMEVDGTVLISFVVSVILGVTAVGTLRTLRFEPQLDRSVFLWGALLLGMVTLAAGLRNSSASWRTPPITRGDIVTILAPVLLTAAIVLFYRGYLARANFSDDEQEAAQFALSLRTHPLPFWDLENGTWGFYPTFMLFAYPMYWLTVVIGETEFAFRALYFGSLFVVFVAVAALGRYFVKRPLAAVEVVTLLAGMALVSVVAGFYNSWHPYIAGLAEPSAVDMFAFSLFATSAYFLYAGLDGWFVAASLLQCASLSSGLVYTVALLGLTASCDSTRRWRAVRLLVVYLGGVAAYFLAASAGNAAINKFSLSGLAYRYFAGVGSVAEGARFLWMITLLSGGTFPLIVVLLWRTRSAQARVLAWLCALQIAAGAVFSPLQHVHYHLPLLMMLYGLGVCVSEWSGSLVRRWMVPLVGGTLAAVAVYLVPKTVSVSENAKALGSVTRVECAAGDLRALYDASEGFENVISWRRHGISLHNWIYYSLRAPAATEPALLVTDLAAALPPGFRELSAGSSCKVLIRQDFSPDEYLPCATYRSEPGWGLLAVPRWRADFPGGDALNPRCASGAGP